MVDVFEADTTQRACCLQCVTVLVRALRVCDTLERQRAVAWSRVRCARGVCLLVRVCVPFLRAVSSHLPVPARLPQGRHLGSPLVTRFGHTPPISVRAGQDPEPLALPWPAWELTSRQQGVSILPSQTSQTKASCCTHKGRTDQCPWWHPIPFRAVFHLVYPKTLPGLYSTETRDSRSTRHHGPNNHAPLRLKTPMSPTSNPVDGTDHVAYPWTDHVRMELIPVASISLRASEPRPHALTQTI